MKLKWIACVAALIALACAHGEEAAYISAQDTLYWHADGTCAGVFSMESDDTSGYFACPVCVNEELEPKIAAVARGGTIILKIPDSWMASRKDIGSVFGWSGNSYFYDEAAKAEVAEYLHGDAYTAFMKQWEETGTAKAKIYEPGIYPRNNELFMNQRHIGGAWYVVMRPEKVSGNSIKIYLRFFGADMEVTEDGAITYAFNDEWGKDGYNLKFSAKKSKGAAFSTESGNVRISVFNELGTHIAVIRQKNADKDLISNTRLSVGDAAEIELAGYMDGTEAVYCCTLTDAEAHIIETGGAYRLLEEEWYTEESFRGTGFALVEKGTGGWGVIDRQEKFVIGPGYRDAQRYGNTVFLTEADRDVVVMNLDTMETLGAFDCPKGGYITVKPVNSAVYAIEISGIWYLYEMGTGFPLAVLPIDEETSPGYSVVMGGIDGDFTAGAQGDPRRLVFWRTDDHVDFWCWIANNHGNRVSDNHQHLEPLLWVGDKGLFTMQTYDEVISHPNNPQKYIEGYDGREFFGENWRVGLLDENGNTVAPAEYVYIKAGPDNVVELHREDGTVEWVRIE